MDAATIDKEQHISHEIAYNAGVAARLAKEAEKERKNIEAKQHTSMKDQIQKVKAAKEIADDKLKVVELMKAAEEKMAAETKD